MKRRRYPLEALRELRRRTTEDRRLDTAKRQTEHQAAEQALSQARAGRQRAEQAAGAVDEAEHARVEQGQARALDLQQHGAWQAGAQGRLDQLRAQETSAQATERKAALAEEHARTRLASADADERVVERHERSWKQRREAADEKAGEEEAAERHAARRPRGPQRGTR